MTERAMVFETCRLGVEATATPGTAVIATKILSSMSIAVTPSPENKTYTPKGFKFPTANVPIREWTDMKLDGIGTYNELVYPLASVLTDPVIATPGGGTLSRTFTYALLDNAPDTQRTYSLEFGTETQRAWHTQNALMNEFGLVFNRKDVVKVAGSAFGQAGLDDKVRWLKIGGSATGGTFTITVGANTTAGIAYNASAGTIQTAIAGLASVGSGNVVCTGGPINTTPVRILFQGTLATATNPTLPSPISVDGTSLTGTSPTIAITRLSPGAAQLDLIPISPTTIDIKTAATQAGLAAASALTRDFQYTWKISGRDNMIWPLASANGAGFGATVEALPKGEATLDVAANDAGMGYLTNIRNGNTLFVRVAATGPLIEGTLYHSLQIDTALKVTKISEFKDIDGGLLGVTYSGEWCHDSTWGYSTQAVLQNTLTAL
jgi:hypothetical protein